MNSFGTTTKWNRSKIMIVGAGRAGKTAFTRSMTGEAFDEHLQSTIGINAFSCDIQEMGAMESIGARTGENGDEADKDNNNKWEKYEERTKLLEGAIARGMKEKEKEKESPKPTGNPMEMKSKPVKPVAVRNRNTEPSQVENIPITSSDQEISTKNTSDTQLEEIFFDENDLSKEITSAETDSEEIVRCLADNVKLAHSKYIVSIYDYGGQSVFNAIHPFLLTKYGVYVVVFDMRELVNNEKDREECLKNIRFWLNAIAIHSYDESRKEMAPIILVGTRKDFIKTPEEHEIVSKLLNETFQRHHAWPFIVSHRKGHGKRGTTTFCFYPVDNREGRNDESIQQILLNMEQEIEKSWFVNEELPLVWLKVIDQMKSLSQPSLTYSTVVSIAKESRMSEKSVPFFLKFLQEMGIAMWHDEPSLRDVIILDPVKYFVEPATVIICKHSQGTKDQDATWHLLKIHEECQRKYFEDWQLMLETGLLSESLLSALLSEYPQREEIVLLMKKYGLLLEFEIGQRREEFVNDGGDGGKRFFLVPSLLPEGLQDRLEDKPDSPNAKETNNPLLRQGKWEFSLAFSASKLLFQGEKLIKKESLKQTGFLPSGLWERFLCRSLQSCFKELTVQDLACNVKREGAFLSYQGQRFEIRHDSLYNRIIVEGFGENPIPIYFRLSEIVQTILDETYGSLKVLTLLSAFPPELQLFNEDLNDYLINFAFIEKSIAENKDLSLLSGSNSCSLSWSVMRSFYNIWLFHYKQTLPLSSYDIFLSYRWNAQDSPLVSSLFQQFCRYDLSSSSSSSSAKEEDKVDYSPISVFVDQQRLQDGENYRNAFVTALLESRVIVPVITVEALKKMIYHDPNQIDNLLLEWILSLGLEETREKGGGKSTEGKIVPIIFGSYELEISTKEIIQIKEITALHDLLLKTEEKEVGEEARNGGKQELKKEKKNILSILPAILPRATIQAADQLLQTKGMNLPTSLETITIPQILERLLLFQGIYCSASSSFQFPMKMDSLAGEFAERLIQSLYLLYHNYPNLKEKRLQNNHDYYFYNQTIAFKVNDEITEKTQTLSLKEENESDYSPKVVKLPPSTANIINYQEAWLLLQKNSKVLDVPALQELLNELGIDAAEEMKYLQESDLRRISLLLKTVPQKQFLQIFNLE
jgi:GTPase SAR1 family protein